MSGQFSDDHEKLKQIKQKHEILVKNHKKSTVLDQNIEKLDNLVKHSEMVFDTNGEPDISKERIDHQEGLPNETEAKIDSLKNVISEVHQICEQTNCDDEHELLADVIQEKLDKVKLRTTDKR